MSSASAVPLPVAMPIAQPIKKNKSPSAPFTASTLPDQKPQQSSDEPPPPYEEQQQPQPQHPQFQPVVSQPVGLHFQPVGIQQQVIYQPQPIMQQQIILNQNQNQQQNHYQPQPQPQHHLQPQYQNHYPPHPHPSQSPSGQEIPLMQFQKNSPATTQSATSAPAAASSSVPAVSSLPEPDWHSSFCGWLCVPFTTLHMMCCCYCLSCQYLLQLSMISVQIAGSPTGYCCDSLVKFCCAPCKFRTRVREISNIKGNECCDGLLVVGCSICALVQAEQEVEWMAKERLKSVSSGINGINNLMGGISTGLDKFVNHALAFGAPPQEQKMRK